MAAGPLIRKKAMRCPAVAVLFLASVGLPALTEVPAVSYYIAANAAAGRRENRMPDEKEIREVARQEKRSEKTGKYKALPRNKQTETEIARIFEYGTERDL